MGFKNVENYTGGALEWFSLNPKRYEGPGTDVQDYFGVIQSESSNTGGGGGSGGGASNTSANDASGTIGGAGEIVQEPNKEWDSMAAVRKAEKRGGKRDDEQVFMRELKNRLQRAVKEKFGTSSIRDPPRNEVEALLKTVQLQMRADMAKREERVSEKVDDLVAEEV
jgi:hypothetical protein